MKKKKEKKVINGGKAYIEEVADLASYIENAGQEENLRNDWISTLR